MQTPLKGMLPVAPTPFLDDGRLDLESMRRVFDCMVDQGVDAICILANYSEQFLLSDQERADLMRLSLEHVSGRVPVIVIVSHFHTGLVVERAKAANSPVLFDNRLQRVAEAAVAHRIGLRMLPLVGLVGPVGARCSLSRRAVRASSGAGSTGAAS